MKDDFRFKGAPTELSRCPHEWGRDQYGTWRCKRCQTLQPLYAPVELAAANSGITHQAVSVFSSVPTEGTKYDSGKPDLSLVSSELMNALAEVRSWAITEKPQPYPRDNWKLGFKYNRSIAAALRHIMAFKDGEDLDRESGLTHIAHALACLEHLLYDLKHHKGNDDRKGG